MTGSPWKTRLDTLAARHLVRKMRIVSGPVGAVVKTPEGDKLGFCSNDYLGLANHPTLKKAMADAALHWGAGTGASRLVSGNTSAHERLQRKLATYMETEDAVVFPSGYQANVGALTALTEKGDVIFSDELVHASLIDGCRLSGATVKVYRHGDMDHLQQLAQGYKAFGGFIRSFVQRHSGLIGHILFVEDSATAAAVIQKILEKHGLKVTRFSTGEEALGVIQRRQGDEPDLDEYDMVS